MSITLLIWIIIAIVGAGSLAALFLTGSTPIRQFVIWFCVSLIGVFLLLRIVSNPFVASFILAAVIATLIIEGSKNE